MIPKPAPVNVGNLINRKLIMNLLQPGLELFFIAKIFVRFPG